MKTDIKLIFLDIDGVLNSERSFYYHKNSGASPWLYDAPWKWHVNHLNWIVEQTGARIVISSTWRGMPGLRMILAMAGLKNEPVIGKTPRLESRIRGEEIQWFLDYFECTKELPGDVERIRKELLGYHGTEKRYRVTNFVILDDDADMAHLMEHLVLIDNKKGLNRKYALEAVKILNGGK